MEVPNSNSRNFQPQRQDAIGLEKLPDAHAQVVPSLRNACFEIGPLESAVIDFAQKVELCCEKTFND